MNPDRFIQSEIEEAARTTAWLLTKQPQDTKWIAQGIPAAWYAISELAPANGITCGRREAHQGHDRRWYAYAVARKPSTQRAQIGAASSKDRMLALCFAYRNAIRQLLPQQGDKAWRETKDNAIRKYA